MRTVSATTTQTLTPKSTMSAKASLNEKGVIDPSTTKVEGELDTKLFKAKKTLGKMDFLKLLTTQLKYQDPMSPSNNTDFIAQLAQFSSLEGTSNIESAISNLEKTFKESLNIQNFNSISMTNATAVSLIGKKICMKQTSLYHDGPFSEGQKIKVHLGDLTSASVQIIDKNNKVIKTLTAQNKDVTNAATIQWDGTDEQSKKVAAGTYTLKVVNEDKNSDLYCFVEDVVEGVKYTAQGPEVKIAGKELPIGNILDISSQVSPEKDPTNDITSSSQLYSLLGKQISYKQSSLQYTPAPGKNIQINVALGGFKSATVQVVDKNNTVVHSMALTSENGTNAYTQIDCKDFNGNGPYTLKLADNTAAYFFKQGIADSISVKNGNPKLCVDGLFIDTRDIVGIEIPKQST